MISCFLKEFANNVNSNRQIQLVKIKNHYFMIKVFRGDLIEISLVFYVIVNFSKVLGEKWL